jgi:membrane-associated PAP2 superfamily phosphatase
MEYSGFDVWFAQHFYDPAQKSWVYGESFLTNQVIHIYGKKFMLLVAFCNFLLIPVSFFVNRLKPFRKHLVYIFVAALTAPVIVVSLKSMTHIYTPWDLSIFGGHFPHIRIFDSVPEGLPIGNAFPGGHSSGGFAYISLFFALTMMRSKYRYIGLAIPLLIGITFSLGQEIRGAHFPSHDTFSFVICWLTSLLLAVLFYGIQKESGAKSS